MKNPFHYPFGDFHVFVLKPFQPFLFIQVFTSHTKKGKGEIGVCFVFLFAAFHQTVDGK